MLNRKLFISAILLTSTFFAGSSSAQAAPETQDVLFNGTYEGGCQFSGKKDGTVTPNALFGATSLGSSTTYPDAVSGEVTVSCNGLLNQVTASEPEVINAPGGANFSAKLSYLDDAPGATPKVILTNTETTIKVDMTATSLSAIPTGDYEFKVVVTATPN
ncbi:hypothetical protein [Mastigocoleus testarum]|uniref:Spore coat protein U domain-containing protein n=1 Tax=Mastigocoleus testarum BC008 TaxID=371196 RepID=A0A0V7ZI93_9CYAN|nr:hypothetical protein [Mastigocoleus testarum]KST64095.1 hypothetical protein BC008_15730 [Mastigocoleus testarum BC008]KST68285.1 hypothetical protein BC008_00565 [Mastigocoleus testarum BC008]